MSFSVDLRKQTVKLHGFFWVT